MNFCYDGLMRARVDWEEKTMEIDSFETNKLPHRPFWPPFYTRTKAILNYISDTEDSISFHVHDFGDSIQFSLYIHNESVEFFGNIPTYNSLSRTDYSDQFSKYDLWVNKSDYLPYRIKRDLPHDISVEACREVSLNKEKLEDFIASSYFPDYPLREKKNSSNNIDLIGKVAPDWTLNDADNKTIGLKDLKTKIVMIQLTGIGCGPCYASVPFLKKLVDEYKNKDFEFVSIETWSSNLTTILNYRNKNQLNYKYLKSNEDIKKQYQNEGEGVPQFYILDQNRVIRKEIKGYNGEVTDMEIRDSIEELL
ncbi:MAG: TlpA family protein disulfide reductase [Bacteroidota bacterium]|nr:TlpA family protein disulfide reductase [Bacteroidota bacterium]